MNLRLNRLLLAFAATILAQSSFAARDSAIRVTLEEPVKAETYAGISNLRGWAAGPSGIEFVEVYIDGKYAFDVPMGGSRQDVGDALPHYPDSDYSGYSMAFNYKNLSKGRHELTIRAIDGIGNYNETSSYFFAEKFNSSFIADGNQVDLSTADGIHQLDQHSLLMSGVSIEGDHWDVTLSWDRASQGFAITQIGPAGSGEAPTSDVYACLTSPDANYYSSDYEVVMKNGLELNNVTGLYWSSSDEHMVFKTSAGKWYTIEDAEELYRLDVTKEPDSCFEYEYGTVTDSRNNSQGQKVLILGDEGEIVVRGGCSIDTGSPVAWYDDPWTSPYLVDLLTAESCEVLDATEY